MLTDELLKRLESYIAAQCEIRIVVSHTSYMINIAAVEERLRLLKLTFPQYLLNFIAERGLNEVDVYKRANLDRRIFSKLRNQKGYMPRKRTIIAIALAMELTLDEAQNLLERGGYSLSEYSKEDVIIAFCFDNKICDLFTVNEALDHYGFKPIS